VDKSVFWFAVFKALRILRFF